MRIPVYAAFAVVMLCLQAPSFAQVTYTQESDGVLFSLPNNGKMKVQVCSDKIIRVVYTLQPSIPRADSNYIVVKGTWDPITWTVEDGASAVSIVTATVRAEVSKTTGAVSFYAGGALILQETQAKKLVSKTVEGHAAYEGVIYFNQTLNNEGIYGFGNLQNIPYNLPYNLRGESMELVQLNEVDCTPFFMSTRGFGVLWINYSRMTVNPPLTLWSNWATNNALDYYFIYGPAFDTVISSYRTITGPAPLWPKWAYGFWQCKNRYESQSQILDVVKSIAVKTTRLTTSFRIGSIIRAGATGASVGKPAVILIQKE